MGNQQKDLFLYITTMHMKGEFNFQKYLNLVYTLTITFDNPYPSYILKVC